MVRRMLKRKERVRIGGEIVWGSVFVWAATGTSWVMQVPNLWLCLFAFCMTFYGVTLFFRHQDIIA